MYDSESRTLWVEFPQADGDTLLTSQDTDVYTRALQVGVWNEKPLEAVRFVFRDVEAAAYNADSLAFVRIETWIEGDPRTRFGDAPDFEVREDGVPG